MSQSSRKYKLSEIIMKWSEYINNFKTWKVLLKIFRV